MIKDKSIIALVPARGGSKGIKLKNLKKIFGKSLIHITSDFIDKCKFIDKKVISSDHKKILSHANKLGFITCKRPASLSGDRVPDNKVIINAIKSLNKKFKIFPDYIIYLQPTSPIRMINDLHNTLKKVIEKNYDSAWSLTKIDNKFHPLKVLNIKNNKVSLYSSKGKGIIARQMLDDKYIRNGEFYIFKVKSFMKYKTIYMKKTLPFITNHPHANIDSLTDLIMAKKIISKKNYKI